jgi:hypothetical protein
MAKRATKAELRDQLIDFAGGLQIFAEQAGQFHGTYVDGQTLQHGSAVCLRDSYSFERRSIPDTRKILSEYATRLSMHRPDDACLRSERIIAAHKAILYIPASKPGGLSQRYADEHRITIERTDDTVAINERLTSSTVWTTRNPDSQQYVDEKIVREQVVEIEAATAEELRFYSNRGLDMAQTCVRFISPLPMLRTMSRPDFSG